MVQLELYVDYIEETERVLHVFDFLTKQEKPGFKLLTDNDHFDIMLFNPVLSKDGISHWKDLGNSERGVGIEIVILTDNISFKRDQISALGYECSDLETMPWGSAEFTFRTKDKYLFRIKQLSA